MKYNFQIHGERKIGQGAYTEDDWIMNKTDEEAKKIIRRWKKRKRFDSARIVSKITVNE
jgi:hypothetical protein